MEQIEILSAAIRNEINISAARSSKLAAYASLIHSENLKFNLTGHKTLEDILTNLIIKSIIPAVFLNVPRGTFFADLGTGAGIPGIPLAVYIENSRGTLFDSSSKKIRFIQDAAEKCGITNVEAVSCRIEEAGKNPDYRESYDWVFSRAMSDIYTACELGSPLLKKGGRLFLYSKEKDFSLKPEFIKHLGSLGLEHVREKSAVYEETALRNPEQEGILLIKKKQCPHKYPRRIAVIRRESEKLNQHSINSNG